MGHQTFPSNFSTPKMATITLRGSSTVFTGVLGANKYHHPLYEDAKKWCYRELRGEFFARPSGKFDFTDLDDAMMFKLVWG